MAVISGGRYDRPEVKIMGVVTKDGVTREFLTPRNKLNRADFREGVVHLFRPAVDELSSLAFQYWGDASKYYIIGEVNNIVDPATIPLHTALFIPSRRELIRLGL